MRGHIRERSPGKWAIILDIYDDAGNRRRKWHSFKGTKRDAQKECARLITEMGTGSYVEPSKLTVAEFLEKWLEDIRARVAPRTFERYAEIARKNLVPLIGSVKLRALKPQQISATYSTALASGRRASRAKTAKSSGLSPQTVHHMHRILRQALEQAVNWQILARNPADLVKPPKVERRPMETYDTAQTVELLESLRGTRLHVAITLAVSCGLRRGEVTALRWRDVDLTAAQVAVRQSAEQTTSGIRYKEPKSGKARTVALSAGVVADLRAHRIGQAEELLRLGIRQSADTFVVAGADGSPIQPNSITHEWVRISSKTALPRIRFHDLRHAHATHMLSSGVHPKVASERLGHSKIGITLDLYSHVLPGMQEDAAARVDAAMQAALQKRAESKG